MNFAILFSGQGLQTLQHIDEVLRAAEQYGISDILKSILPEIYQENIQHLDIYRNDIAQPLIFALQWCRWQTVRPLLDDVIACAGYSLGELSALSCSTEIDFELGLNLAKQRAELMSNAVNQSSGLASVKGLNIETLNQILAETSTELSIKLNDSSFIVGGLLIQLEEFIQRAEQAGAQVKKLNVSIPSHTSLMQSAVTPYQLYLNQQKLNRLEIPVISGIGGVKLFQSSQVIQSLIYQMDHPIDWDLCLEALKENLPDVVLEIGPGNALSKMMQEIQPNINVRSIDDFKSLDGLTSWLEKIQRF